MPRDFRKIGMFVYTPLATPEGQMWVSSNNGGNMRLVYLEDWKEYPTARDPENPSPSSRRIRDAVKDAKKIVRSLATDTTSPSWILLWMDADSLGDRVDITDEEYVSKIKVLLEHAWASCTHVTTRPQVHSAVEKVVEALQDGDKP